MNNGINLIGDKKQKQLSPLLSRFNIFRYAAIALLFGVSVASMILFLLISFSPLPALQQQEQTSMQTLSGFQTDMAKIAIINERMQSINQLLTDRSSYGEIFSLIEGKLPNDTDVTAFNLIQNTATITISSTSLASFDSVLNSLIAEEGTRFSQVSMNNLIIDEQEDRFFMTIALTLPIAAGAESTAQGE